MRRRGFFQRTGKRQIYLALFLGVVTSGYIWIPTIRELEVKRRTLDSDTKNTSSFQGKDEITIYFNITRSRPFYTHHSLPQIPLIINLLLFKPTLAHTGHIELSKDNITNTTEEKK